MSVRLSFLGAAQNVTGSCYLVEAGDQRVLVDCGFFQERDYQHRNWDPFPVPPASVDAVLLTHGHLDHVGLLPKLARDGFKGRIFCTSATGDITAIVLADSARLQMEDAKHKQKRHKRERRRSPHHPVKPLYTTKDAEKVPPLLTPVEYGKPVTVAAGIKATFKNVGHILGSAMIRLTVENGAKPIRILFSGDVGRWERPILRDPDLPEETDYLVTESTYGDRVHDAVEDVQTALAKIINVTSNEGGNILIPSFAIERSQELLYYLSRLRQERKIPPLMVFLDSPMAIKVTGVFRRHKDRYDQDMRELLDDGHRPFSFDGLKMVRSREESKSINNLRGSAIIIAGSGMCTGGRIKHHLVHNIQRPQSTILFVGYQARGTLGRRLVEGAKEVRIFGGMRQVRARVEQIQGFSGHADRNELLRWIEGLKAPPQHVFVTHGGAKVSKKFAQLLHEETGWPTSTPAYRESVELE